jgi:hypothetical protein
MMARNTQLAGRRARDALRIRRSGRALSSDECAGAAMLNDDVATQAEVLVGAAPYIAGAFSLFGGRDPCTPVATTVSYAIIRAGESLSCTRVRSSSRRDERDRGQAC